MKLQKLYFIFLPVLIFLISGCANDINKLRTYPKLINQNTNPKNNILILVKALNQKETSRHFGVNLIKKNFIPIHIQITNLGDNNYTLSQSYINLPLVNSARISELLHKNTSLFFWLCSPIFFIFWPAMLLVGAQSFNYYQNNQDVDCLVKECCIDPESNPIKIEAYDRLDKFIFIEASQFVPAFELKLFNNSLNKFETFCINLQNS